MGPGQSTAGLGEVLGAFASGVTLVTVADERDDIGTTVSAFCPVSVDPPLVLVSLIAGSYPAELLGRLDRFAVTLLAAGRGLSGDRVHELARGRVWTGADALANELVDELGGLDRAADVARTRAGLPPAAPVRIYPRVRPLDRLRAPASSDSRPAAPAGLAAGLLAETWGPVWRLAARAGFAPDGPLMLPGSWTFE